MATLDVAKVNGTLIVKDTLFKTAQVSAWQVALSNVLTVDTQAGGAGTAITEGTARRVAEELGSTAMMFEITTNLKDIIIVGDSHALDAASIKARVEAVTGLTATVTELTSLVGVTATA